MKIADLSPAANKKEVFRRNRQRFVPIVEGCYALTNFDTDVLYVGLTNNLRRRFGQHLDSDQKVALTPLGRAILFWWIETNDTYKIERTWMNIQNEGILPLLNGAYSPTAT